MKLNKNTGITLIALVVTIIVLLILAGITLSLALNSNGVFQRSKNAAAAYKEAEEAEREELERIGEEMDEVMGIFPPLEIPENLEEGAEITYEPSGTFHWDAELATTWEDHESKSIDAKYRGDLTDYEYLDMNLATGEQIPEGSIDMNINTWKVFNIDREKGEIILMPKKIAFDYDKENDIMSGIVFLQGSQGYNNGVKLLNDACSSLYGNPKKGIMARSINRDDIEQIIIDENIKNSEGKTYLEVSKEWWLDGVRNPNELTENKRFPSIYAKEKNSIIDGILNKNGLNPSQQNSYISRTESVKIGNTNYTSVKGFVEPTSIQPERTSWSLSESELNAALNTKKDFIIPTEGYAFYWIATRSTGNPNGRPAIGNIEENSTDYCIYKMDSGMGGYNLCGSSEYENIDASGLFPIVTIKSGIISENETQGYTLTIN